MPKAAPTRQPASDGAIGKYSRLGCVRFKRKALLYEDSYIILLLMPILYYISFKIKGFDTVELIL